MHGRWIMNGKFMIDHSIAMEARGRGVGDAGTVVFH